MDKLFKLRLFEAFGVELEYMIVDKKTLNVKPIADILFEQTLGHPGNEVIMPTVSWSNELALHVVEIKTTEPTSDFVGLSEAFAKNIKLINEKLSEFDARLMPTAAHPWMNPANETRLWPNENSEIYNTYNKIFNCQGHGWSNLQSTHINLPFQGDDEFARLHAAIRLILPVLPALAASSPALDGKPTGFLDTRLTYYEKNQARIPSITARVIPEPVYTEKHYREAVFDVIGRDIAVFDEKKVLEPIWLNSRGAIARFDRGAIEIRIIDIQECPAADLAILALVIGALRLLVNETLIPLAGQQKWATERLYPIYRQTLQHGENATIDDQDYLAIFGFESQTPVKATDLWFHLLDILLKRQIDFIEPWKSQLMVILNEGSLSTRILKALDNDFSHENLKRVYKKLAKRLKKNRMFVV